MGNQTSKHKQLNKVINEITTNVIVEMGSSASTLTLQEQEMIIANVRGTVSSIEQLQKANISITSLMETNTTTNLQNKLINDIESKIKQMGSTFPSINKSHDETDIQNIIRNHVSTNFNTRALQSMSTEIQQKQKIAIANVEDTGLVEMLKQSETIDVIGKQVNKMSSDITSELLTETKSKVETESKRQFFGTEMLKAWGDNLMGMLGGATEAANSPAGIIVIIVILLVLIGGGYFYLKGPPKPQLPQFEPEMPMGPMMQPEMPMGQIPMMQQQMMY